jgi:Ser/Thr protein kinase RdoA (MazF antagonist)
MVAMDRVGDANWGEVVKTFDKVFCIRFARLLEAVKSLHESGFIHADLNIDNVRVKRKDPEFVATIDFGTMGSYGSVLTREWDMTTLRMMLDRLSGERPDWVDEFAAEIMNLPREPRPQY